MSRTIKKLETYYSGLKTALDKPWVIVDWAGNLMDYGRFKSFEDGEDFLCERLGDAYETDRCEYYVVEDTIQRGDR